MTITTTTFGLSRRNFLRTGISAGAAGLALGGLPVLAEVTATGGNLRARLYADIAGLDPAYWTSGSDALVMEAIFAFSMEFEANSGAFNAKPLALKSVTVRDDKHIDFELHAGIKYSGDYGEMTAEDAKFSWERIADPANESPYAADWAQLDHVEVTGTHTGTIVLKEPFAPLFTSTLPATSGIILPRAAIEAAGGQFTTEPPVTSGPYRIREWQPRTRLVLERNPDFTLFDVAFDTIEFLPIEDPKTAELGFEAGDLDHAQTSISSIPRYQGAVPGGGSFQDYTALSYYWLGMNEANVGLTDIRVRRAIQHGISREAVVEAAYLGAAQPAAGIIAPGLVGNRTENTYNYDPDTARALLAEAGVSSLEISLAIQQTAEDLAAAQVIQAMLADIGVTVRIDQHESGSFWSLGVEADGDSWKELQMFLFSFTMQPDPSWATMWFTSDQVGVWNWQRFSNAEFDALNAAAVVEMDQAKRHEMYVQMQALLEESGDVVYLTYEPVGVLTAAGIVSAMRPDGWPILARYGRA
ncbi:ABC transporter substrate-binding protein [Xinfangfangia sp. CPCC 101601]|uniref:ABC transporter substrate-binding protein n=1 Tax=Pseudogemmobacter lacusdianii TaxID=3069608 RepID=A0ABU0VW15_9RHOB|nr:ABC transporter substrate-binding protein [Xinfangfangia sp. CPCC 101601]MDQ2065130.1 ABC transporter substrate-binding protein [Xinfangfangia sp. CPCC 101601]